MASFRQGRRSAFHINRKTTARRASSIVRERCPTTHRQPARAGLEQSVVARALDRALPKLFRHLARSHRSPLPPSRALAPTRVGILPRATARGCARGCARRATPSTSRGRCRDPITHEPTRTKNYPSTRAFVQTSTRTSRPSRARTCAAHPRAHRGSVAHGDGLFLESHTEKREISTSTRTTDDDDESKEGSTGESVALDGRSRGPAVVVVVVGRRTTDDGARVVLFSLARVDRDPGRVLATRETDA